MGGRTCGSLGKKLFKRALGGGSRGATLAEVVIAIAVLGFVVATVPAALLVINQNQYRWNEQRTAENLTRNQIEYIKVTAYIAGNATNPRPQYKEVPVPVDNWDIVVYAQPMLLPNGDDKGLQEITVSVWHVNKLVLETKNYKVDRTEIWRPES